MTSKVTGHHHHHDDCDTHVHFKNDQVNPAHSGLIVVDVDDQEKVVSVQLGFLQEQRHYEVEFEIPKYLGECLKSLQPHPHLKMLRSSENGVLGHSVVLELFTAHDRLLEESLQIKSEETQETYTLTIFARVLGKGKGTPFLKSGIRCTGIEYSDSDLSETEAHPGK